MPTSDSGDRETRNDGRRQIAQEDKNNEHDEHDGERKFELDIGHRSPDRIRAVTQDRNVEGARQARLDLRQQGLDAIDDLDDVRARLSLNIEQDRRRFIGPGRDLGIFRAANRGRDVRQSDGISVAIGDNDFVELARVSDLIVRVDGRRLRGAVKTAFRRIDVHIADCRADIVDVETVCGQRARIELNTNRRPVTAADADEADAGLLRNLLREPRFDEVFDRRQGQGLRRDRDREDRRVAGLTFA